jgi:hypothetical protein
MLLTLSGPYRWSLPVGLLIASNFADSANLQIREKGKIHVRNEETLDRIRARLGTSPSKSLVRPAQQTGELVSPVRSATKLLHLHPHKTTVVYELYETDRDAKVNFANCYRHAVVHEGQHIPHSFCFATNDIISEDM